MISRQKLNKSPKSKRKSSKWKEKSNMDKH